MNHVYSYFAETPHSEAFRDVIAVWRDRWERIGWTPILLGEDLAKQHPRFSEVDALVASFPTVNTVEYERACWMRWLAIEVIGGGFMVDLDVVPIEDQFTLPDVGESFCAEPTKTPCAVSVKGTDISDKILTHPHRFVLESGRPHYSDMFMFKSMPITTVDLCREVGSEQWKSVVLAHFASGAIHHLGYSKETFREAVNDLLPAPTR